MTEVEITRLFAELAKQAETLNKKSDSINTMIERFEENLCGLNIGLAVWLVNHPLSSKKRISEEDGETATAMTDDTELGFAKVKDEWCVAVRVATYEPNPEYPYGGSDPVMTEAPIPLTAVSRRLRINALELFPELLKAIKEEVDEALKSIESAEKFVK